MFCTGSFAYKVEPFVPILMFCGQLIHANLVLSIHANLLNLNLTIVNMPIVSGSCHSYQFSQFTPPTQRPH